MHDLLTQEQRQALIGKHPIFSLLSESHIQHLAQLMYEIPIPEGFTIVSEGEPVDSLYIIFRGEAKIISHAVSAESTDKIVKGKLGAGDGIGISEANLFSKLGSRTATVVALSEMVLLGISLGSFASFMQHVNELYPGLNKASHKLLQINIIENIEPFAYMNAENVHIILEKIEEKHFLPGQALFEKNAVANDCYLVLKGAVELTMEDPVAKQKKTMQLRPFQVFGETGVLMLGHYQVSARILKEGELLVIPGALFLDAIREDPIMIRIMKAISKQGLCPKQISQISVEQDKMSDGQVVYILKKPGHNQFYRLSPEGWFIWKQLNGAKTISDMSAYYTENFFEERTDDIILLVAHLISMQFVTAPLSFDLSDKKSYWGRIRLFFMKFHHE